MRRDEMISFVRGLSAMEKRILKVLLDEEYSHEENAKKPIKKKVPSAQFHKRAGIHNGSAHRIHAG
jgi:hypothetical protein